MCCIPQLIGCFFHFIFYVVSSGQQEGTNIISTKLAGDMQECVTKTILFIQFSIRTEFQYQRNPLSLHNALKNIHFCLVIQESFRFPSLIFLLLTNSQSFQKPNLSNVFEVEAKVLYLLTNAQIPAPPNLELGLNQESFHKRND